MKIDTSTKATIEAIDTLAKMRGVSADELMKSEVAAHRRLSRRGALYRAILKPQPASVVCCA